MQTDGTKKVIGETWEFLEMLSAFEEMAVKNAVYKIGTVPGRTMKFA